MEVVMEHLPLVHDATQRLVLTVDGRTDNQWSEPSLLPGWSRAHVIAHLALNAEGMVGAVHGLRIGRPVPMYASNEQRDADIEKLAGTDLTSLRERFFA